MNKNQYNHEKGGVVTLLVTLTMLTLFLFFIFFFVFGKVIPPNMIGIRRNLVSIPGFITGGYQEDGLNPGLQWKIPYVSNIILIPRDFQFVQMDDREVEGDLSLSKLEIPTTDGSKVKTDISLIVRFFDKPGTTLRIGTTENQTLATGGDNDVPLVKEVSRTHGGPKDLVNTYTADYNKQLVAFATNAENYLKQWLSGLSTTDYYNPALREKAAFKATEEINKGLNKDGIELWATLIRRYVYSEQNIDDQIFAKNLQDATERLNAAKSELAEARAQTEEVRAIWDGQKISVLKVEGESTVQVLDEEAKKYEQEQIAKGDKLVEISSAAIEKDKNEILATQGGKIYAARKMVPFISSLQGGIITGIDPYNMTQWIDKFSSTNKTGEK